MLTVKDIMTKKVYTVGFDDSAGQAAWGLTLNQVGAAPVKNREGQLVGILTKGDLVDPEPKEWIKKEATVGDLMDPEIIAVYEDDPALEAAHKPVPVRSSRSPQQALQLQSQFSAPRRGNCLPAKIPQSASFSFSFPPSLPTPTGKASGLPKFQALKFNYLEAGQE